LIKEKDIEKGKEEKIGRRLGKDKRNPETSSGLKV